MVIDQFITHFHLHAGAGLYEIAPQQRHQNRIHRVAHINDEGLAKSYRHLKNRLEVCVTLIEDLNDTVFQRFTQPVHDGTGRVENQRWHRGSEEDHGVLHGECVGG